MRPEQKEKLMARFIMSLLSRGALSKLSSCYHHHDTRTRRQAQRGPPGAARAQRTPESSPYCLDPSSPALVPEVRIHDEVISHRFSR